MAKRHGAFAVSGLAVLCLFAHGATAKTDSLTVEQRIQRVFPFQVGQQYEFQSAESFYRPNGDSLPPYTIAEITVTDTVINGKTYLHIPYWSSFGTEYYRLDDSLRIWNYSPDSSAERVLLNFGTNRNQHMMFFYQFADRCFEVMSTRDNGSFIDDSIHIDRPFCWAYSRVTSASFDPMSRFCTFITGWTTSDGTTDSDTVLAYAFERGIMPAEGISDIFGIGAPGASRHRQGLHYGVRQESQKVSIGVFRPISGEPWSLLRKWTPTAVEEQAPVPSRYVLSIYPNPFNAKTIIGYTTPSSSVVSLAVYSANGQHVRTLLVGRYVSAGTHSAIWDGRNDVGQAVGSGVYFVRLGTPAAVVTTKLTLLR